MTASTTVVGLPDDINERDTHAIALALAATGLFVFPLKGTTARRADYATETEWHQAWKEPHRDAGAWSVSSTRDVRQITAWFAGSSGLGIGIDCGKSGIVVVDEDHVGMIDDLLVPTLVVRTGKGLHHYYARPPGRRLGNAVGTMPKGFGDIRGEGGYVVGPGSPHGSGIRYEVLDPHAPMVGLPDSIASRLVDRADAVDAATDRAVAEFLRATVVPTPRTKLLDAVVAKAARDVDDKASRHVTCVAVLTWSLKEAAAGYYNAADAVDRITEWFAKVKPDAGRSEFADMVRWAVAQAIDADPAETRRDTEASLARHDLGRLWRSLDTFLESYDRLPILATLAAAATSKLDGEPLWLLLVGAPSGGKTEAVRLIEGFADDFISELTGAAALLSWTKGKNPKPSGLLARLGDDNKSTVTIRDLSPLLASSDRGGRDEVYSKLRDIYDGRCRREVGQNPQPLQWDGRLTVVAAVTPAIDNYASHAQALGDRWLYLRLTTSDEATARKKAKRALSHKADDVEARRKKAQWVASDILTRAVETIATVQLTDDSYDDLADAAVFVSRARAVVPRHGYGRREVDGMPIIEEVPRLARQLGLLARGLVAIGLDEVEAVDAAIRAAVESAPPARVVLISALVGDMAATGEILSFSQAELARTAKLHKHVVRMQLEELSCVGVVERDGEPTHDEDDDGETPSKRGDRRPWRLSKGDITESVTTVLGRYRSAPK